MNGVLLADSLSLAAMAFTVAVLIRHRHNRALRRVRAILWALVAVMLFGSVSNVLEWSGVSSFLDPMEDYTQLMQPLMWLFLVYGLLQRSLYDEIEAREKRYRSLSENVDLGITLVDGENRIVMTNAAQARIAGRPVSELVGQPCHAIYPAFAAQCEGRSECPGRRSVRENAIVETNLHCRRRESDDRIYHVRALPLPADAGAGFIEIVEDVTERKRIEDALRESEERYRTLFEGASEGIVIAEAESRRIRYANPSARRLLSDDPEAILDRRVDDLLAGGWGVSTADGGSPRALAEGPEVREIDLRRANGERFIAKVSWSAMRIGDRDCLAGFFTDVTELRRADEEKRQLEIQVQHAQKLESLGVLAGGIAHDFNNLLVAILGNAELAMLELPAGSPAQGYLGEVQKASERAADLCRQMLAYSGKGRSESTAVDLGQLIREMLQILRVSISKNADLQVDIDGDAPAVTADPTRIRQVVMNLITNASESLGDGGGVVRVRCGARDCTEDFLRRCFAAEQARCGRFTFVEVEDNGMGMDEATVKRMFEPFFTTKFAGRGLGMSSVLGIVRSHKGAIEVVSAPGRGTRIAIYLPAGVPAELPETAPVRCDAGWRGEGVVMVVDDEASVRGVARRMLEHMGFEVVEASSGMEAVERFQALTGAVRCVLLDLTMPGMDGVQTADALRHIHAGVRILPSSGFSEEEVLARIGDMTAGAFIQKPYQHHQLEKALRRVLQEEPPADRLAGSVTALEQADGDRHPSPR